MVGQFSKPVDMIICARLLSSVEDEVRTPKT
jgi:hypothetical protein